MALQEQLAEEEQEKKELEKRRRELREKIDKLSDEITKVKGRNAELQSKVRGRCTLSHECTYVYGPMISP